jgi:hypothetical protein
MEKSNLKAIPEQDLAMALEKINEVVTLLEPYIINLTPMERKSLFKMGDKSLAFNEKAFEYAKSNPSYAPVYMDMVKYEADMYGATSVRTLLLTVKQLEQGLSDTVMVSGGEAFNQSLIFYNAVKQAARQDVPGAKAIYSELRVRFPGSRTRPKEKTES